MPIDASPSGTLDIENATLRSRGIVALTNMVAGNDVVRADGPALEVYGDPGPRLELVSNTAATDGTATFTRLESNVGVFSIQSGADASTNGPITFGGFANERMRITSDGNVGVGTTDPAKLLEISGASGLDNSTPVHFRITNTQSATNGSPFTDLTKPSGLISFYTPDTSTAGPGDVAGIGFRCENTLGGDTALCFYTDSDNTDDPVAPLQERMCITHDGNVGVGTTNPGTKLHVKVPSSSSLVWGTTITNPYNGVTDSQGIGLKLQMDGSATWYGDDKWCGIAAVAEGNYSDELGLAFYTQGNIGSDPGNAPTEKVRIKHNGNVGIGVTNPGQKLHVNGNAQISLVGIKSSSGNYSTSGVYTGLNVNGGSGGGLIIMMVTHQNNSADNTGMFVHVIRKRYSGAGAFFPYGPVVQLVNSSAGTTAGTSITYYTDSGGVLKFQFNGSRNYKWAAIEL